MKIENGEEKDFDICYKFCSRIEIFERGGKNEFGRRWNWKDVGNLKKFTNRREKFMMIENGGEKDFDVC